MWDKLKPKILRVQEVALCVVRKWWRPLGELTLVGAAFVNSIYLPLHKGEGVSLVELAALITSFAPVVAIRAWEKKSSPDSE